MTNSTSNNKHSCAHWQGSSRARATWRAAILLSLSLLITACSTDDDGPGIIIGERSLSGVVYDDANANGRRDRNELPLDDITLFLDSDEDGRRDANEVSVQTDSNGRYVFEGLEFGETYTVLQDLPFGWRNTDGGGFVIVQDNTTHNGRLDSTAITSSKTQLEPKIVGGGDAQLDDFPFMAVIEAASGGTLCTGALLTQGVVLTAAHCFFDSLGNLASPSDLRVRTSTATLETPEASLGDIFTVRRVVVHENYTTARGYDIALLELASLSEQPTIPLLTNDLEDLTAPLASAVVIGWGALADGSTPVTLQEANSTLVDPQVCFDNDNFFTDDRELCILQDGGNAAPCFGDSGGPLLVHDDRGIWYHAGVLSRGSVPCGEAGDPDIYTSAVALTDWILENATEVSRGYRVQLDRDETFNDLDFGNTRTLEPAGPTSQLAQAYITNLQITGLPATNINRLIRIDTPLTFSWQVAEGSPGMVCELDVDDNGRTDFETSCEGGTYSFEFEGYDRNVSYTPTLSVELDGAVRQRSERINVISPDNEEIGVPEGRNGSLSLGDSVIARRYIDYYDLETNGTQTVTIELESDDFDTFLQLFNRDSFELIDANDDGGPGLDSRLIFTPQAGRRYLIGVTSATIDTGRYVLRTLLE